ncbi:MAG: fumarate reductase iron-sulfur subunit [Spirochaetes bacterium]|jgi:fumarate reductase iron-sulfur subunit|nr:fumarate reductase iron-sulfur subunit [Spirochaetota bacterium]
MDKCKKVKIFRFVPGSDLKPRFKRYSVVPTGDTVLSLILQIRNEVDHSLKFDYVCRAGVCGSCAMLINGRPALACRARLDDYGSALTLAPLPGFLLLGDLSVDTGSYFIRMYQNQAMNLHRTKEEEIAYALSCRHDNETMLRIYELDRCIECGCCVSACATAQMNSSFVGAAELLNAWRIMVDPRDPRDDEFWYRLYATDNGVFGCTALLACDSSCPKNIPLASSLASFRIALLKLGVTT